MIMLIYMCVSYYLLLLSYPSQWFQVLKIITLLAKAEFSFPFSRAYFPSSCLSLSPPPPDHLPPCNLPARHSPPSPTPCLQYLIVFRQRKYCWNRSLFQISDTPSDVERVRSEMVTTQELVFTGNP